MIEIAIPQKTFTIGKNAANDKKTPKLMGVFVFEQPRLYQSSSL